MEFEPAAKQLKKYVKGSNISIQKSATDGVSDPHLALLYAINGDDVTEVQWLNRTLRPDKNLIHPATGFRQGIKALRPAAAFNTFDMKRSKLRRLAKQEKDRQAALKRRAAEVAPTAAYRAAINPHKIPRTGGHAPEEEVRLLSRGRKPKAAHGAEDGDVNKYFVKWAKKKTQKIGKGL